MYVPGFGEGSPEKKAAINLQHFFNYIAVRIVLAQLEVYTYRYENRQNEPAEQALLTILSSANKKEKSYNREAYVELKEFVSRTSLNDAEVFCEKLIRESPKLKGLAMRILEVSTKNHGSHGRRTWFIGWANGEL